MMRGNVAHNCKVVLLGEQAVGKTSLALRFVKNQFLQFHVPTIGAAYLTKSLYLNDCIIKFEIWDTAGQERFRCIAPMYYRGAKAAIVVYDITNHNSFIKAKDWVGELREKANPNLIIILAGNKTDLDDNREVQTQKAATYAEKENLEFLETSAKSNRNIEEIFCEIGNRCPITSRQADRFEVHPPTTPTRKSCC